MARETLKRKNGQNFLMGLLWIRGDMKVLRMDCTILGCKSGGRWGHLLRKKTLDKEQSCGEMRI